MENAQKTEKGLARELRKASRRLEELERIEGELRSSEEKFASIFRYSPLGISLTRLSDGTVLEINDSYSAFTGYTREEVIGRKVTELNIWANPSDRERLLAMIKESGRVTNEEFYFNTKSGDVHAVLVSAETINVAGEDCLLVMAVDIAGRKESDFLVSSLFYNAQLGMYLVQDNRFKIVNPQIMQQTGMSEAELLNTNPSDIVHPEDLAATRRNTVLMLKGQRTEPYEFRIVHKSGEYRTIMEVVTSVIYHGKRAILANCMDITERKKAGKIIGESEEKFHNLFEGARDAIILADWDTGLLIDINPAGCRMFGLPKEQIVGKNISELQPPETVGRLIQIIREHVKKEPVPSGDALIRRGDGTTLHVELTASMVKTGDKTIIQGVFRDITRRKRVEETLRFSDAAFKSLHESVIAVDNENSITYWNDMSEQVFGVKASEAVGKNLFNVIHIIPTSPGQIQALHRKLTDQGYDRNEVRYRTPRGDIWVDMTVQDIESDEACYGRVITALDITGRKQAEEAMKESEEKFSKAFNASSNSMCIISLKTGNIMDASESFLRFSGYSREETIGHNAYALNIWENPEDQKMLERMITESGRFTNIEIQYRIKSGERRTCLTSGEMINIHGEPCLISEAADITARKQAEEALKESEEKFSKAFNASANAISIRSMKSGRYLEVNDAFTRFTGYSRDEAVGHIAEEMNLWVNEEEKKRWLDTMQKEGNAFNQEFRSRMKSGEIRFGLGSSDIINIRGEPCRMTVITDITARKQAEEAIKEREKRFSDIAENALEWIWETDANGRYIYSSPVVEKIMGYKSEEILGKYFYDFFSPEYQGEIKKVAFEAFAQKQPFREFVNQNVRKDGKAVWLSTNGTPIVDEKGNLLGYRGADTDITERKKAEEALRESEEKFFKIFSGSGNAINITSLPDNKFVEVNEAYCQFTGYSREEVIGHSAAELNLWVHDDELQRFVKMLATDGKFTNQEFSSRRKSGEVRIGLGSAEIINIRGKPHRLVVVADITERKMAEEALKESEEFNATLLTNNPDAIFVTYPDGTIKFVNPAFEKLTGFSLVEIIGMKHPYPWWPKDKKDEIESSLEEAAPGEGINLGKESTKQMTFQKKTGELFTVELNATSINKNGQRQYILVTWIDITERQKAEEALRESEEKFAKAFNASANAICITSLSDNRFIEINESFTRFTGYSHGEVIGQSAADLKLWVKPEEQKRWLDAIEKDGRASNQEFSSRMKSGEIRIGLASAEVINIVGEPCRIVVITDITERKKAEENLKHSEENFRNSLDDSPLGIRIVDATGGTIYMNRALLAIYGYSSYEEFIITPLEKRFTPEMYRKHLEMRQKMSDGKFIPSSGETSIVRKDGEIRHLEILTKDVLWNGQKQFQLMYQDITERKTAEEGRQRAMADLELSSARLAAANKELEAFSYSVSHDLRSPLRSIDGFSQALLEDYAEKLDPTAQDYLGRLRNASQKMGELIDGLLKLSRLTRSEMHREQIDLSALADEIATRLGEISPERQAEFVISPGLTADGDPELLRVLLENLLGNAWKFTGKVPQAKIEFGAVPGSTPRTFFVKDNGAGFDMTYVNKLFGAFQRLHDVSEFPGTGIGLATVQRIINRHGGTVRAEGEVGKGATFYFTLS